MRTTGSGPTPIAHLPRRRWTNEEFDRLVALGFIREGSATYLWDGEIVEPTAEDNPHNNAVSHLRRIVEHCLPEAEWTLNTGFPIELAEGYRPQPDLSVVRGPRSNYRARGRRPRPEDVALLVEVSDTTYASDAGPFLGRYAEAGIPDYWIVHLAARRIEAYSGPSPEGYRRRVDHGLGEAVPLAFAPGLVAVAVAVAEVFLALAAWSSVMTPAWQDDPAGGSALASRGRRG